MTESLRALSRHLGIAAGPGTETVANRVVMAAGNAVAEQARQNAPRRSGALAQSIQVQVISKDTVKVFAAVPYSGDVERGTRPHTITPRAGRVLAFSVDGRRVFARIVHHPGTSAEPFLGQAVQTGLGGVTEQLGRAGVSLIVSGDSGL